MMMMQDIKPKLLLFSLLIGAGMFAAANPPQRVVLDLSTTVQLANDSSLSAYRAKHTYRASYWEHRSFKANRLPSLFLDMMPVTYNRTFVSRYNSEENIDVYRQQQTFRSSAGLSISQNLDLTGGSFFINSNLEYLRNFGENGFHQYSGVPIRVGYMQRLIGYNPFRWEKKIEPVKYEKAQKQLLFQLEQAAENVTGYFFDLAMAQAEYALAKESVATTDTLYRVGEERHKIASIGKADLLTLQLDRVNARNTLQNAEIRLKRAMFALVSFLNLDKQTEIVLELPDFPGESPLSVEDALIYAKAYNPQRLEASQRILESEQILDKTRKEAMFNASFSASVGFNKAASRWQDVYYHPLQQDGLSLSISVPLIDWGVRRGRVNMARSQLSITQLTVQQQEVRLEEEVIMTVGDFAVQQQLIRSASEAHELSNLAYEQTRERFIIGKADISRLTLASQRRQEAQRNYISSLKNYWQSYYKLRKLTLYDFVNDRPISYDWKVE